MANQEFLGLLDDVAAWNEYKLEHPDTSLDFAGANLERAILTRADLAWAKLTGVSLTGAKLDLKSTSWMAP